MGSHSNSLMAIHLANHSNSLSPFHLASRTNSNCFHLFLPEVLVLAD